MRAVAVLVFLLATTLAAAAAPSTAVDVFRTFGLFGTWAVDCGRPASLRNPYVNDILESGGDVAEEHHLGPDYAVNHYKVLSATRLSATQLALEVIFQPGSESAERQKLEMQVVDGRRRTMFNQPKGGTVRVKNGVVLGANLDTPTLVKCR